MFSHTGARERARQAEERCGGRVVPLFEAERVDAVVTQRAEVRDEQSDVCVAERAGVWGCEWGWGWRVGVLEEEGVVEHAGTHEVRGVQERRDGIPLVSATCMVARSQDVVRLRFCGCRRRDCVCVCVPMIRW